jgi:hypothetical protein
MLIQVGHVGKAYEQITVAAAFGEERVKTFLAVLLRFAEVRTCLPCQLQLAGFCHILQTLLIAGKFQLELACSSVTDMGI